MTQSFVMMFEKKVVQNCKDLSQFEQGCKGDKARNDGKHYKENAYCLATMKENLLMLKCQIDSVIAEMN